MGKNSKSKTRKTRAEKADKFKCYQLSVQSPENEIEMFDQIYYEAFKRKAYTLREDFCGTFAVCCEWVKSHARRTAVGVDLCPETLQWGIDNNRSRLTDAQSNRIRLLEQDVRKRNRPQVEILAAQNFSFWLFKTRKEVVDYFKIARANLNAKGVMVMDMMGGGECYTEGHVDKRTIKKGRKGFKYLWEQNCFNPITADCSFYIHFKFGDGSKIKKAFEYHWRFWTIPEVREMLAEAGFRESHVYFEIEDADGKDTGKWARTDVYPSHASWLAYIVGIK